MKVIYINYLYDQKGLSVGATVHVREFVRAASALGVDIHAFNLNKFADLDENTPSRIRVWLKQRTPFWLRQLKAVIGNAGYFRREWELISHEKPDAIIVRYNLMHFSAPLVGKLKKIPLILEVNAPMVYEMKHFVHKGFHLPLLPNWIEMLNLKLADRITVVSTALKRFFADQGVPEDKMSVVPNGVDVERFHPDVDAGEVKRQYGLHDKLIIGFVGSFHYWHGVEYFEEMIADLIRKYPDIHFLLVGEGPLRKGLQENLRAQDLLKNVSFTGYVPYEQIPAYLAAMDIAIAPYPPIRKFYFSPLKLFEYMATGLPVVASRVGQIAEIIKDGYNGLLFEPGNTRECIENVSQLIESKALRQNMGLAAHQTIHQNYSWRANAQRIIQLISELISKKQELVPTPTEA